MGAAEEAAALDAALIALHGGPDSAGLAELHRRAARLLSDDPGARRFHLTHAWVYALESGAAPEVAALESELRDAGGL